MGVAADRRVVVITGASSGIGRAMAHAFAARGDSVVRLELRARVDAERSAARASLAPVEREEWWVKPRREEAAAAWETARAWSEVDPDARRVAVRRVCAVRPAASTPA